jgi:hypothetical protein
MTGHPILILSQKFEFVFFLFSALKDLSKMISYLYFGYLDQKLHVFFKNRYFYKKKVFGQNELTCSFRKVQNKIYIFLSKIWRPTFIDVQYFRVVTVYILFFPPMRHLTQKKLQKCVAYSLVE